MGTNEQASATRPRWDIPANAATDRGWLFGCTRACCEKCLGFFLDYRGTPEGDERRVSAPVLAVVIGHAPHPTNPKGCITSDRPSRWFATTAEAIAWIESESTGQQALAV